MMKIITDSNEANDLLKQFTEAKVRVDMYSRSLNRVALKVKLSDRNEVIFIIAVGCESMNGSFKFVNKDLSIILNDDEGSVTIQDTISDFKLITSGGFSMVYGLESEFGDSFDTFLKNE